MSGAVATNVSIDGFLRQSGISLAGHVFRFAHGLLLMPLIIRSADVTSYGNYVLAIGALDFLFGISSFGLGFRASRYLPSTHGREGRAALFWPQLIGHLAIALGIATLLIAFGPLFSRLLLGPDSGLRVWLCVSYFVAYVFFAQTNAYLRYTLRIVGCTLQSTAYVYLFVGTAMAVAWSGRPLTANLLFGVQAVALIVISAPVAWVTLREIGLRPVWPKADELARDVAFGFPIVLTFVVDAVLSVGDRYMLRAFVGVEAVGYYAVGYAVGSLPLFFPRAVGMVLPQMLAVCIDDGRREDARRLMSATMHAYLLLSVPYLVGCALIGRALIAVAVGPDVAAQAWQVAAIVALGQIFFGMTLVLIQGLQVSLDTQYIFRLNAQVAILNVVLNVIALQWWPSPITAALTTVASYAVLYGGARQRLGVDLRPSISAKNLRKVLVSAGAMGLSLIAVLRGLPAPAGLLELAVVIGIGVASFALAAVLQAGGNWRAAMPSV